MPAVYGQLRRCLSIQALIGKSHASFLQEEAEDFTRLGIRNEEKTKLGMLLAKDNLAGVGALLRTLCAKWRQKRFPQVSCQFSVKYLITEIYRVYPELQKKYTMEELLYQIDAVIGASLWFEDFEGGIGGLLDQLHGDVRGGKTNKSIEDAVSLLEEYIRLHFSDNISIESFAGQFGYHPVYVPNQFTVRKKVSPNRLLTNLRMEKAKDYLTHSDYLLKDIAEMTGYKDISYFSRTFKENTGCSPKQFREKVRSN